MKSTFFFLRKTLLLLGFSLILNACENSDYYILNEGGGRLEDLRGKWVVINYWADWCPPCLKEMPELSAFYETNKEEVLVFAYNFDQLQGEELQDQINNFNVNVPSLLTDPGLLFGWKEPGSLPATFILDPEGNLLESLIGPQTKESLEFLIERYKRSTLKKVQD